LMLITKQPAQIAQIAFGHFVEYFCFFLCPLDRGRVKLPKKRSASPHKRNVGLCGAFAWH